MSEFVINDDKTKGKIKDVVFCYVKMQQGSFKYQSKTELEYCVDCIVPKDVAKAFKKMFPKNGFKEIDTEEFEDKYKIPPVHPNADEQFIIKLKANAQVKVDIPKANLKAGDDVPYEWNTRPKAYVPVDGGIKDITMTTLISNGSKGDVAFRINENSYGSFPQLTGILVKELIEYEQQGQETDFGNVVGGYNPGDGNPQQVADTGGECDDESVGGENNNLQPIIEDDIPF